MPVCKKCGQEHFNFRDCPKPVQRIFRHPAASGWKFSAGWGTNTVRPTIWRHPARVRTGKLIPPVTPEGET